MRLWVAIAAVLLTPGMVRAGPTNTDVHWDGTPEEELKYARDAFQSGDYAKALGWAEDLINKNNLANGADRVEVRRIAGMCSYYRQDKLAAEDHFHRLLQMNPAYRLPLHSPPKAVQLLDDVRKEHAGELEETVALPPVAEATVAEARRSARRQDEPRHIASAEAPGPPRHVKLHWNAATASLRINNQEIPPGISPDWEGDVPGGTTMQVTLTSKYFRPETKSYPIPRDGTDPLDFRISLKPAEAMIHVDTDRPEGIIIVDGERVGSVHDFNQGGGHPVAMAPEQLERLVTVRLEPPPDAKDLFNPVAKTVKVTAGTTTPAALTVGDR